MKIHQMHNSLEELSLVTAQDVKSHLLPLTQEKFINYVHIAVTYKEKDLEDGKQKLKERMVRVDVVAKLFQPNIVNLSYALGAEWLLGQEKPIGQLKANVFIVLALTILLMVTTRSAKDVVIMIR